MNIIEIHHELKTLKRKYYAGIYPKYSTLSVWDDSDMPVNFSFTYFTSDLQRQNAIENFNSAHYDVSYMRETTSLNYYVKKFLRMAKYENDVAIEDLFVDCYKYVDNNIILRDYLKMCRKKRRNNLLQNFTTPAKISNKILFELDGNKILY